MATLIKIVRFALGQDLKKSEIVVTVFERASCLVVLFCFDPRARFDGSRGWSCCARVEHRVSACRPIAGSADSV